MSTSRFAAIARSHQRRLRPFGRLEVTSLSNVIAMELAACYPAIMRLASTTMTQDLVVLRVGDAWSVLHSGRRWGRFSFKVDAEEAAIRLASRSRVAGAEVRIYVQSSAGELTQLQVA
jgi:hypothetical protein